MLASLTGPAVGALSYIPSPPLTGRVNSMFQALGHLALKLLQNAIHYICILSPLGARSPLSASGDTSSSID